MTGDLFYSSYELPQAMPSTDLVSFSHGRYVIVPLIKPDSSAALLFAVACMVTGASLFSMGAIKVRLAK